MELHRAGCLMRAGDIDEGAWHTVRVLERLPAEFGRDALVRRTAILSLSLAPPSAITHPQAGFEIVIAYVGGEPVGQAFGYTLPSTSKWWDGLTSPVPDGFTTETGTRTFAFNELMVVPAWQGKGVAHALHDELLAGRSEERATLLVREDNASAQLAYRRWGWEKAGKLRPYPDAPHFDSMIRPLFGRD